MSFLTNVKDYFRKNRYLGHFYEILYWKKIYKYNNIPDKDFAKIIYKKIVGKELNIENPRTFDEKQWYLKLFNRDPLLTKCTDKYLVREYVKDCGLGHILNNIFAIYDNANQINFNEFPENRVFLKCNHTSGYNVIYDKNKPFDKKAFIRKFNFILQQNYYWASRDMEL